MSEMTGFLAKELQAMRDQRDAACEQLVRVCQRVLDEDIPDNLRVALQMVLAQPHLTHPVQPLEGNHP